MSSRERNLYAVFNLVRACFNKMKALAEQLHQDLGVNPSMRAVMEALSRNGSQSVPDIAKAKGVSRQHIQTVMNALQAEGLVEPFDNPAHKRSPLFDMTPKGRKTFALIQQREREPLQRLAAAIAPEQLKAAEAALLELNEKLSTELRKENDNGDEGPGL